MENRGKLIFNRTKEFIIFLRDHANPDEVAAKNLELARKHKLPLLKFFEHVPDKKLLEYIKTNLGSFFDQVENDTAFDHAIENLEQWKAGGFHEISRTDVKVEDLVLTYSIRKQMLLHFLPQFTSDVPTAVEISLELERFYSRLLKFSFKTFVDIHQEELHNKNTFLQSIVQNSIEGIYAFDTNFKITEWNAALEKRYDLKKEEVIGKEIFDFFPEYKTSEEGKALYRALQGETTLLNNVKSKANNGWFNAYVIPLYDQKGEVSYVLCMVNDISESKRKELTLQQQREELEAINEELRLSLEELENTQRGLRERQDLLEESQKIARLGSWEFDFANNVVYWSEEMKRLFGIRSKNANLSYDAYLNMVHPDDQKKLSEAVKECIENHNPYVIEHRIIRKDGKTLWLLGQGKAILENGKIIKLRGTGIDITERKEAELEKLKEQHFINAITETSPDIITVYDLEKDQNIYANKNIYDVLGYNQEGWDGIIKEDNFFEELIHPEDSAKLRSFIDSFKKYKGDETLNIDYRIRNSVGVYRYINGRYKVFKRNTRGFPIQIIGVSRDVSDKNVAEEELKTAFRQLKMTHEELLKTEELLQQNNNMLEERVQQRTEELMEKNSHLERLNIDLDNFIYSASHDLKSPISNLEGLFFMLEKNLEGHLNEKTENLIEMMMLSLNRLKNTIHGLAEVTRVQKDIEEEVEVSSSFEKISEEILQDISGQIAAHNARIKFDFKVSEIIFPEKNLRSLLYNLISNAVKYHSQNRIPEIKVSTYLEEDEVVLIVQDNGLGIPLNQQEKVFSFFKRYHTQTEGSGIGLYLVKRIVESSGSKIFLESEPEKGSKFIIRFNRKYSL